MALCHDLSGNLWAGTEDMGVACYSPVTNTWRQYRTKDGLGDDNAYALCCDRLGRVWAGTLNHGVSVFNGKTWRTYDQKTGPLGAHVVALATSPVTGDVWMATEAGLVRYSLSLNTWQYYTRADGLPSDQTNALAFGKDGTLYVGTQCDGIAIGTYQDKYQKWRRVTGPDNVPNTLSGRDLPSNLINAILVSRDGGVYVGTDAGLSRSLDGGSSWRYTRGADWQDKLNGLFHPKRSAQSEVEPFSEPLREDYVTSLAQDEKGHILVGHRQQGVEALDPETGKHITLTANSVTGNDYVFTMIALDQTTLVGSYGGGLLLLDPTAVVAVASGKVPSLSPPPFPVIAKPPTIVALQAMTRQIQSQDNPIPVGGAVCLGQDWVTQGDWVGRYGRQYALLCAMQSPWGDHLPISSSQYVVHGDIGPHHALHDSLRSWITQLQTDKLKSLYDPEIGCRRQAEHDDHGEGYRSTKRLFAFEGPDLWYTIEVPKGIQRLSLYFLNKDGHVGNNRDRDYVVRIKSYRKTIDSADSLPDLAHFRVNNFWNGVYQQFIVSGPCRLYVKIDKNNSLNTLCSGIFIDNLQDEMSNVEDMHTVWLGSVRYDPPDVDAQRYSGMLTAARTLWSALEGTINETNSILLQSSYRLHAYRAALADNGSPALLANWRWQCHLWEESDRVDFTKSMALAYKSAVELHPQIKMMPH